MTAELLVPPALARAEAECVIEYYLANAELDVALGLSDALGRSKLQSFWLFGS